MNILGNRLKGKHNPTTQSLKGQKYMLDLQPKQKRINKNLKTLPIKPGFELPLPFQTSWFASFCISNGSQHQFWAFCTEIDWIIAIGSKGGSWS